MVILGMLFACLCRAGLRHTHTPWLLLTNYLFTHTHSRAGPNEANPDFEELMQQHGVTREEQQQQDGAAAAGAGDAEMQDADADAQQENIPPAGGSLQQGTQASGDKQQQGGGKQAQASGMQQMTQPHKAVKISNEKYEFIKVGRLLLLLVCLHACFRCVCSLLFGTELELAACSMDPALSAGQVASLKTACVHGCTSAAGLQEH
jgi:hypothetical protein